MLFRSKRAKLIKTEKVTREMALKQFEQLLRAMRLELRLLTNKIVYYQGYMEVMNNQLTSLSEIIKACETQQEKGFLSAAELTRTKLALYELENESNDLCIEMNRAQRELKNLLSLNDSTRLFIQATEVSYPQPRQLSLPWLIELSRDNRMELILARLQTS